MSRSRKLPEISDAEWRVMKTLWEKSPRTAREVVEALATETTWKPKTIHTLLARLVKKGALKAEKETREYQFLPLVRSDECQRQESLSFLERVFDGDVAPFLACFVRDNKLTKAEIEELKKILDGKAK
jgi:BlaI family transcriptional regulator, penicillinase repressor